MSCAFGGTWATAEDLYSRFGDEFVDKLAIRRKWDSDLQQYVADESDAGKEAVIELALSDAQSMLRQKLSCLYGNVYIIDETTFEPIKQWHIKLAIETLKIGGDCYACACNVDIDNYFKCGTICDAEGNCLSSRSTFISATEAVFPCECYGSCSCC